MFNKKAYQLILFAAMMLLVSGISAGAKDFNPIKFEMDTLDNGLQVIYHVDKSAPVVATVVHYRVGSHDENPQKTGYAHFFEHLMFEATDNIPRASLDKYVEEASGTLNAATSFDQTVYFLKLPANELKLALWIESQRMRKLHVDEIGVETQRGVVLEELKMRTENSPYGTLLNNICENLFPGSSYSWSVIGSAEHIAKAKISDFKEFYDNFYQPNNATLVVSGDIDIEEARELVEDYFNIYPKGKEPVRKPIPVKPMKEDVKKEIIDEKAQLPGMFIGFRAPSMLDSNYYAMSLLLDIFASGESSRLYRRLVDKEQAAVQAALFPLDLQYGGAVIFYAIASPGQSLSNLESIVYDEIDKLVTEGISEEEFLKAKNIKEAGFVSGKTNVLEKAKTLAKYNSYFGQPGMINTEIEKYKNIKKSDLIRIAKKYFKDGNKVVLNYVPKKN